MATCPTCGVEIRWARTPAGVWLPLDAQPRPAGTVVLGEGGVAFPYGAADEVPPAAGPRYAVHPCRRVGCPPTPGAGPEPGQGELFPGQRDRERERGDSL